MQIESTVEQEVHIQSKEEIDASHQRTTANSPSTLEEEWIVIKMDNTLFTTTRNTLTQDKSSMLAVMFEKGSPFYLAQDLTHPLKPYLLDRNPNYFEPVLHFLRQGMNLDDIILDPKIPLKAIYLEAKYFGIQSLVEYLEPKLEDLSAASNPQHCELSRRDIIKALLRCSNGASGRLRFQGLILQGINLSGLDLSAINFARCDLQGAKLNRCSLEHSDFRDCNLSGAEFSNSSLNNAKLKGSNMIRSNFSNCSLIGADISNCDLSNSQMKFTDLTGCDLSNSSLSNVDLTGANLKSVKLKGTKMNGITTDACVGVSVGGVIKV